GCGVGKRQRSSRPNTPSPLKPQQRTSSVVVTPHPLVPPKAISLHVCPPCMGPAGLSCVCSASASWLARLLPQHHPVPLVVIPQVPEPPAATRAKVISGRTARGTGTAPPLTPSPTMRPLLLLPQQCIPPPMAMAQACPAPTSRVTNRSGLAIGVG